MSKEPENGYRKPNNCPYCGYFCDAATFSGEGKKAPKSGDLSFCLMCLGPSEFDKNMKMIKFDLNSIDDIVERNRLKGMQIKMEEFWEINPDKSGRREKFLKERDRREVLNNG